MRVVVRPKTSWGAELLYPWFENTRQWILFLRRTSRDTTGGIHASATLAITHKLIVLFSKAQTFTELRFFQFALPRAPYPKYIYQGEKRMEPFVSQCRSRYQAIQWNYGQTTCCPLAVRPNKVLRTLDPRIHWWSRMCRWHTTNYFIMSLRKYKSKDIF